MELSQIASRGFGSPLCLAAINHATHPLFANLLPADKGLAMVLGVEMRSTES